VPNYNGSAPPICRNEKIEKLRFVRQAAQLAEEFEAQQKERKTSIGTKWAMEGGRLTQTEEGGSQTAVDALGCAYSIGNPVAPG
jgi:hypothetical protein